MALTVAQLVARLSADTSGFYKGMAVANSSMIRTGGIIGRVAAGAGLATVAMGFMAARAAGNFQQSMNILGAVSGATSKQMDAMSKKAIALGADLKLPNTSAKDAADAMVELSKGGLSVNQILTATRGTIQLAVAGNLSMADAATINARALKTFNLDGSQATKIANLLAAGANKSTAEIGDLAEGMQNAGGQFVGAGWNIQSLTVSLAELVDKGMTGANAGTALKTMIQRLENPTGKAADKMKDWGISIADASGKIRPLPVIIGQFQKAMENLSPIQKQHALNTIFGARANQAMMKLVDGGTEGWKKYSKAIVGTDAAQKMAEARTKGFNGSLQGFQSSIETLAIQLGTAMLPALTDAVHAMSIFIESINPDKVIAFFTTIIKTGEAIVTFVAHSKTLTAILGGVIAGFLAFKSIMWVIETFKAIRASVIAMNAAMLANPVVLIAAAVIALGAALVILYERSATVRRIINELGAYLKTTLGPAFEFVKEKVVEAALWVAQEFQKMEQWVRQHSEQIKAVIRAAWTVISTIVKTELAVIEAIFKVVWPYLKTILQGVWNEMKIIVTTAINLIRDAIHLALDIIHGHWGKAWGDLKSLVSDALTGVWKLVKNSLTTLATLVWNLAKEVGLAILHGAEAGLKGLPGMLAHAVVSPFEGAFNTAKSFLGINSPSKLFGELGKGIAEGIIKYMLDEISSLPSKLSASLKTAFEAAKAVVDAQRTKFADAFSRLADYALQAFDAQTQKGLDKITARFDAARTKIQADFDSFMAYLDAQGNAPTEAGAELQKEQAARDQAQRDSDLSKAQHDLNIAQTPEEVAAAQKELDDAQWAQRQFDLQTQDAAEKAQKDARIAADKAIAEKNLAAQQADIDKKQKKATLNYQAERNLQRQHLEDQLKDLEKALEKRGITEAQFHSKMMTLYKKYGIDYRSAGNNLGLAFAQGMRDSFNQVEKTAQAIAALIAKYLKLNSPSEKGPLSSLDTWFTAFAPTLLSGIKPGLIDDALSASLTPNLSGVGAASNFMSLSGRSTAAGAPIVVNVQVEGSVRADKDLASTILDIFHKEAYRKPGGNLTPVR